MNLEALSIISQSKGHGSYSPMLDMAAYVHVCVHLAQFVCLLKSGLTQSLIQVRPTGSGLLWVGSALSGRRPDAKAVCGAQEEEKEHTRSPSFINSLRYSQTLEKTLIYPGVMTQLDSPDSSEAQSDKVFSDTPTSNEIKALIQGGPVRSPGLYRESGLSLSFLLYLSIFGPKIGSLSLASAFQSHADASKAVHTVIGDLEMCKKRFLEALREVSSVINTSPAQQQ